MKDIYIHIGLPKTATTWLQKEVFGKMKNINYVRNFTFYTYIDKKTIISDEHITAYVTWETVKERLQKLSRMYPEAKIIVGFRDVETWIPSFYSEYVKGGGCKKFEDWRKEFEFIDYKKYLTLLNSLFDSVYVYCFKDVVHNRERLVKSLCEFVKEPIPNYKNKIYNKKFSGSKLNLMRKTNMLFKTPFNPNGKIPRVFRAGLWMLIRLVSEER